MRPPAGQEGALMRLNDLKCLRGRERGLKGPSSRLVVLVLLLLLKRISQKICSGVPRMSWGGFKKRRGNEEEKGESRMPCHFARKSETYGLFFPSPWHTEFINFITFCFLDWIVSTSKFLHFRVVIPILLKIVIFNVLFISFYIHSKTSAKYFD